jgi:hypothetical protein
MQKYYEMKSKNLPTEEVTEEEFVKLMMETGKTEKEAKFQATISKGLGATTEVNGRMLQIK